MSIAYPPDSTTGFELSSDAIAAACLYIELWHAPEDCQSAKAPWMLGLNTNKNTALLFRPRCKVWSCPPCAEINKNRLILRILRASENYIDAGIQPSFFTLTASPKIVTPEGSKKVFRRSWHSLTERIRRHFGQTPYVIVPEQHQSLRWHWHGLMFGGPGRRWLKDNAPECGFGYMVDLQPARTARGCAWYAAEYTNKAIAGGGFKAGDRRYSTSRNFPQLPEIEQNPEWSFQIVAKNSVASQIGFYQANKFRVIVAGSASAWTKVEEINNAQIL